MIQRNEKIYHTLELEDLILLKYKAIYRLNVIPIKLCVTCSTRLGQIVLNFLWKCKKPELSKQSWGKRTKHES